MAEQKGNFYIPHITGTKEPLPAMRHEGGILDGFVSHDTYFSQIATEYCVIADALHTLDYSPEIFPRFLDDTAMLGELGLRRPFGVILLNHAPYLKSGIDVFGPTTLAGILSPGDYHRLKAFEPMAQLIGRQYREFMKDVHLLESEELNESFVSVTDFAMKMGEVGLRTNLQSTLLGFRHSG